MDLSKVFDYIPHELNAYGFDLNSRHFFYSYLKNRKHSVKINNTCSNSFIWSPSRINTGAYAIQHFHK